MATWAELETAEPEMAASAFPKPPDMHFALAFLATVRPDGGPRVHPFCPIFAGGRLFAAIGRSSPKCNDLRRDARYVIHALPGPNDAEFSVRGAATEVDDPAVLASVYAAVDASGVGGMMGSVRRDVVFEFDIERADAAHWERVGEPGTFAVRRRWIAPA
ncbi:MAG TPA: pyridoxamine 5'-phosphate oxidase family protein [Acidimicrobiia bacterium]